jgi:hypothetical protein
MKSNTAEIYGIEFEGKIVYVGVTTVGVKRRLNKHYHDSRLNRGAKKFGQWLKSKPIFVVKILEYCPTEIRMEREKHWINHYDTQKNGYNGEPFCGVGRPKGCSNPKGKDHAQWGKPAHPNAIKNSVKARIGKPLSDEHKEKIRLGNLKRTDQAIKVRCIETGVIYRSIGEASKAHNFTRANLHRHFRGKTKKCAGFTFEKIIEGKNANYKDV